MQSRGWIDLYLPAKVAYHVKILLGGFAIAVFFNILWQRELITSDFWIIVGMLIVQLEIFMVIAQKIFRGGVTKTPAQYKHKIITRLLVFYFIVLAISSVFVLLLILSNMLFSDASFPDMLRQFVSDGLTRFILSWAVGVGIASVVFFYSEWNGALKREQKLREEKLIFQYETLKNQVNPHFLFNSLNTLASLVFKDAELSEKFINKFSGIYRYILENKDKETVNLLEEITFVQNYFFLQKIRDDGKISLDVSIDHPETYQCVPISLQMLVENALKHNVATEKNPLAIRIYMANNETLVVENNLQKKMHVVSSSKIGLKNLKERISLAMDKQLVVGEGPDKFIVQLPVMKISHERTDH